MGSLSGIVAIISCAFAEPAPTPQINDQLTVEEMRAGPSVLNEPIIPVWQLEELNTAVQDASSDSDLSNLEEPIDVFPKTQISGEAVFSFIYAAGDRSNTDQPIQPSLGNRLRLNIETNFTDNDRFRLRLQTTNIAELDDVFETDLARLSIQGDDQNQVSLSRLDYQFPIGDKTQVFMQAIGGSISDVADPLNPLLSGSSRGSISRFGQRNPLYRQGGNVGIGLSHDFNKHINLSLGYLGDNLDLFSDEEAIAFAQLTLEPDDSFRLGLLYTYGLNSLDSGTGSQWANDPFADQSNAITAHSVGLQATSKISDQLTVSGWAGYTQATATDLSNHPQAGILNWAFTLGYSDLFRNHNLGGLIIGRPPHVISRPHQTSPVWHIEVFYQIRMNDHITITPGIVVITNPEQDLNRSTIVVGTLRTLFRF
ncbi:iron uptake porin [Acaryochloris marina NIES-2412]|uniref:iron uptake porin n=1 Tax=Acaryochloris marina TaxID=155978 RepID=UPI00405825A8